MTDGDASSAKVRKCAVCAEPLTDDVYRPFCSKRCADVDLGRWLNGSYAIAGGSADDEDDQPRDEPSITPSHDENG